MQKYDIYKDISTRTGGDMYIGVVGPVRTGKSTFIRKFMEQMVIPNISDKFKKQISTDEMPQSADGKTIMTTQPSFVPSNAVKVQFKNKASASVRLVDCVGYSVEGANGFGEEDKPRLIKTPWDDKEMPFEEAAERGTEKVIKEYSTIGIVVTTDGSFGEIQRNGFVKAEDKAIDELKRLNKPFVVIVNSSMPDSDNAVKVANEIEQKHGVSVLCKNLAEIDGSGINEIMEKVLYEFPMCNFDIDLPKWMRVLSSDSSIIKELIENIKESSQKMRKMRDYIELNNVFEDSENFCIPELKEIKLGEGVCEYEVKAKDGLFLKTLSAECGEDIADDYSLMSVIKKYSDDSRRYTKLKNAISEAEENGYGVVMPTVDEMDLDEPILVKQGGKFGVKLKATAPSLHIMKVNVSTEVSPLVGSEKQGEDLVNSLMSRFEDNPKEIWDTDIFGKPLHDLVSEGLSDKIERMPKETQNKMRRTLTRIVNESRGGVICILL